MKIIHEIIFHISENRLQTDELKWRKMSENHLLNAKENCLFVQNGDIINFPYRSDCILPNETINKCANMTDICL